MFRITCLPSTQLLLKLVLIYNNNNINNNNISKLVKRFKNLTLYLKMLRQGRNRSFLNRIDWNFH
jgi:hypothetical protein